MNRRVTAVWLSMALITASLAIVLVRAGDATNESIGAPEARPTDRDPAIAPSLNQTSFELVTTAPDEITRDRVVTANPTPVHERPSVVIRVVDESGEPIPDSPVAWGFADSGDLPPYRASTNPRGEIELDASELDALFAGKEEHRLLVASLEASGDAYRIERSRADAEAEGVALRLPTLAEVVVEIVEDGVLLADRVDMTLQVRVPGASGHYPFRPTRDVAGRSVFTRVPVGGELVARAEFLGLKFDSPTSPAPTSISGSNPPIRISIPRISRLCFRVLSPEGEPLRLRSVAVRRHTANPFATSDVVALDAEGRGRLAWPLDIDSGEEPSFTLTHAPPDGARSSVKADLRGCLIPGVVELGDLRLQEIPTSWFGIVRAKDGTLIQGATVTARTTFKAPEPHERIEETVTDPSGRFALRIEPKYGEMVLEVRATGFLPSMRTFEADPMGLILEMDRLGRILGRLAPEERRSERSTIVGAMHRAEESSNEPIWRRFVADVSPDGRFVVPDLEPGTYSLQFGPATHVEARRIDGIEVRANEVTTDPRLQDLVLPR